MPNVDNGKILHESAGKGKAEAGTRRRCWFRVGLYGALGVAVGLALLALIGRLRAAAAEGELRVGVLPGSRSGALLIESARLPGDVIEFRSCEAVLDGDRDFGMFEIELAPRAGGERPGWEVADGAWAYRWTYPEGIGVEFSAAVEEHGLQLAYTIENRTTETLRRVHLHPCLLTTRAPSFFPATAQQWEALVDKRPVEIDYRPLLERVFLWSAGERFSMRDSGLGADSVHVSFMRAGAPAIEWAWWENSARTFDLPLVAVSSKDGRQTVALGFERAIWASCNVGDARACVHLFPHFGQLAPGERSTVEGRLYVIEGPPEEALARFRKDFGK